MMNSMLANKLRGGMGQPGPMQGRPNSPLARSLMSNMPPQDVGGPPDAMYMPIGQSPVSPQMPLAPPPTSNVGSRLPEGTWAPPPPQTTPAPTAADAGQGQFTEDQVYMLRNAASQGNPGNTVSQRLPDLAGLFSNEGGGMYSINSNAVPGALARGYDASRETPEQWAQYAARELRGLDNSN